MKLKVSTAKLRKEDCINIIYKLSDEIISYSINESYVDEYVEDIIEYYERNLHISKHVLEELGLIDRFKEKYSSRRPNYKTNKEVFEDLLEFISCEYNDNGHINLENIIDQFSKKYDNNLSPGNQQALTELYKIFG